MSVTGSKRLVRRAIQYALENKRRSVTLVHKGNIMKFTEGAFRDWGYELVKEEFSDVVRDRGRGRRPTRPTGKVLVKDRIADSMFQQVLLRPDEYDVLATPNLNGDYLSDACAAQVGGLGMAPGANIGDEHGVFEATHGTAPKYAGQDVINPSSLILSGVDDVPVHGLEGGRRPDREGHHRDHPAEARHLRSAPPDGRRVKLKTSEFAAAIVENMAQRRLSNAFEEDT